MTEATMLFRQVHPTFVQLGRVTSQAFRPTPKDEKRLSVYDGDLIEPEAAWVHYTSELAFASDGVMALTVAEFGSESLPAVSDPAPFPEHVIVDYSAFSDGQIEKKSEVDPKNWAP
jgi:hypothetical protein